MNDYFMRKYPFAHGEPSPSAQGKTFAHSPIMIEECLPGLLPIKSSALLLRAGNPWSKGFDIEPELEE